MSGIKRLHFVGASSFVLFGGGGRAETESQASLSVPKEQTVLFCSVSASVSPLPMAPCAGSAWPHGPRLPVPRHRGGFQRAVPVAVRAQIRGGREQRLHRRQMASASRRFPLPTICSRRLSDATSSRSKVRGANFGDRLPLLRDFRGLGGGSLGRL